MTSLPNRNSLPIAVGIRSGASSRAGGLCTDGRTVTLHGIPILTVHGTSTKDSGEVNYDISIRFGGWVTPTTCNNLNSVLLRLGSEFRVGRHNDRPYVYRIVDGGKEAMRVKPDQWVRLDMEFTGYLVQDGCETPRLE